MTDISGNILADTIEQCRLRIEQALNDKLPAATTHPASLHQAIRYSALAGGKYIRPLLVYTTGQIFGANMTQLDAPACAVELIHAYSLVHDDLPAMDDDDLRRGKPTCHKAFSEATAILAGDALQSLAFGILAEDQQLNVSSETRLKMIQFLATGSQGMACGQAIDLESEGKALSLAELENMHMNKTGALIRTSVQLGALTAESISKKELACLDEYAKCIGLAFQIRDDILDIEGDTAVIGKPQGSDLARNKSTYPALLGLDGAKQKALEMHHQAQMALSEIDTNTELLEMLSEYIVMREK